MLAVKVVAAMAAVPKAHVEKASAATVSAATVSAATVNAATVSAAMVSAAMVSVAMVSAAIDDPVADEIAKTTVAVEIVQSVAIVVPSLARPAASHREPTPPKQSVAGPISVRRVRRDQKVRHRRHSPAKRVAPTSRHAAVVPSVVPNSPLSATSLGTSATNLGTSAASLGTSVTNRGTSVAASHAIVAVSPDESRRLPIQQRLPRKWNPCAAVARPPHHREVLPIRVSVVVVVAVVVVDAAVIAHSPARTAAAPSRRPLTSPIRRVSPQTRALSRSTLLVAPLTQALSRSTLLVAPLTRAPSRLQPRLDRADRRPVVVKTQPQTPRAQVMPTWTATMTMQAQRSSACVQCPR